MQREFRCSSGECSKRSTILVGWHEDDASSTATNQPVNDLAPTMIAHDRKRKHSAGWNEQRLLEYVQEITQEYCLGPDIKAEFRFSQNPELNGTV